MVSRTYIFLTRKCPYSAGNNLTGTIPTELGALFLLGKRQNINIISPDILTLTQSDCTGSLILWGNGLTGTIPTEIGSLSVLCEYHSRSCLLVLVRTLVFLTCAQLCYCLFCSLSSARYKFPDWKHPNRNR
jgi:hypothetical protein